MAERIFMIVYTGSLRSLYRVIAQFIPGHCTIYTRSLLLPKRGISLLI